MAHRLTADALDEVQPQPGEREATPDATSVAASQDARFDSPDLQQLRALLLHDDRTEIADLRDHLARLDNRVGSDEALGQSTETVLLDTLKRLHRLQAPQLRQALAPAVVKTIRSEVRNSREELVNVLYPFMGKMVGAAIRDAMRKLTDNINESVERASNPALLMARVKAKLTGRPVSAQLLKGGNAAAIERAIVVERVSGSVHSSYSTDDRVDEDLVGGLISALSTFATQTYAHRNSDLRTIELDGHQLILRHSPIFLLALEVDGDPTPGQVELIDRLFLDLMTEQDADPDALDDDRLERFVGDVASWKPQRKRSIVPALLAVALVAGAAWFAFQQWQARAFDAQVEELREMVAARDGLDAFGLRVTGNADAQRITVKGLVPPDFDAAEFEARAARALNDGVALTVAVQPIATEGDAGSARIAQLEDRVAWVTGELAGLRAERNARAVARIVGHAIHLAPGGTYRDLSAPAQLADLARAITTLGRRVEIRAHGQTGAGELVKRDLVARGVPERLLRIATTDTAGPADAGKADRVTFALEPS